jgi:hypothetical protein
MKKFVSYLTLFVVSNLCGQIANAQDHGHLNVGAVGKNQNDALMFDESEIFDTASGYVKTLIFTNSGRFAGYYQGNITLTALSITPTHTAYSPEAPAAGSWIFGGIASVEGPEGGAFGFWDTGTIAPSITVPCGSTDMVIFMAADLLQPNRESM